jgi:hypothetical protein
MKIKIDNDNYFDIAEALHAVLILWHDGQYGYEVLCKSKFKPGMGWSESDVEESNEFFKNIESLVDKKQGYNDISDLMDELNNFVDSLE